VRVWYRVRDLEAGRSFYADKLGFTETAFDEDERWVELERGEMRIALTEGEPVEAGVATIDVDDAKGEAERLRSQDVEVGTVLELHNEIRLLDVFDPDGNRVQLVEQLRRD
jgi:catechol 2,3-dioxygenase-like lactoylglutathione lyase family enzyme